MTEPQLFAELAQQLGISEHQIAATVALLDDGATIPFIARYRKEATGTLDEVQIAHIRDGITRLRERETRREYILKTIEEQGKLSDDLKKRINEAQNITELEDLYLPYKPKRRTRATIAREKGLEPLATWLMAQNNGSPTDEANKYIDTEKKVLNTDEALSGARDIIAEWINETAQARDRVRRLFERLGKISSKVASGKEEEAQKYKDYFDWSEPVSRIPSHRLLAILRAANEGLLRYGIEPDEELALDTLNRLFVRYSNPCAEQIKLAAKDAYKRLMQPSLETETRNTAKDKADTEAIQVFADNLMQLLLASPLGEKRVLAIDPGFRTGCKTVCLNEHGKLLYHTAIYPHDNSPTRRFEATSVVENLCEEYKIEAIAIGNGTAGRETFQFIQRMQLPNITVVLVNESGASVYSASEVAREEFADYDLTVRGAVSIGRRLIDPLAELVKIDAKAIGVGQYQHDVDQTQLKKQLDDVVVSCVNKVGVDVNTASKELLTYVSGIGPKLAQNMINYRNENGGFKSRAELKKVAGLGPKAFEQSAGFLRIRDAKHPLDTSAVHPETYPIVEQMAKDNNCTIADLIAQKELRSQINLQKYLTDKVGLPTLTDIMAELAKPGRDPRQDFETTTYDERVTSIDDLHEGMILAGVITNVTNFGAFVDIGLHESGLIHISELSDRRITDPKQVVKLQQKVTVRVLSVDKQRKRIQLSMKGM
ncbi:MAG: RNA-binding transcriptional accessory protein [Sphingobacteriales bacterium]|nr:RNA-binding transcriptional accessory protein [Sphingobacteriales bacterium]